MALCNFIIPNFKVNSIFNSLPTGLFCMPFLSSADIFQNLVLGGSVVEYLTRDRGAVGSSLTSFTVLCP